MEPPKRESFSSLIGELVVAVAVSDAAPTVARWLHLASRVFLVYVALIFVLSVTGYPAEAFIVLGLTPAIGMLAVIFLVPGGALGVFFWPAWTETRSGSVIGRLLRRFSSGVVGAGWFAFVLGNDVNDVLRFRWEHPWLSALLCIFAVPAISRELTEEEGWGLWGVGAGILSGIVFALDAVRFLSSG